MTCATLQVMEEVVAFNIGFINGLMLGIEAASLPFAKWSIVIDLFLVRIMIIRLPDNWEDEE